VEQNISIQDYLPDGILVLTDYAQVSLRIEIEKMMKKTLSISTQDIKFASLADGLSAKVTGNQSKVTVTVKGFASVLDALEEDDFTPYVDCEDLQEGTYHLKVQLDLEDSNIIVKSDKITVRIDAADAENNSENAETTKKEDDSQAASDKEPSSSPVSQETQD
jgi:YbbR domain-containing protein